MDYIKLGEDNKLFEIREDRIYYNIKSKKNYKLEPEERVRAETLTRIVLDYNYPLEYINFEVGTAIGSKPDIPADIVIFSDTEHKAPYIVYELKRHDVSQKEYDNAINQGFSYAVTQNAKFLVISSGIKTLYYEVLKDKPRERQENLIADIPKYGEKEIRAYKYAKGGVNGFELEKIEEKELTDIFKSCHDALWAGGKRNPSESFDELDKLVFCKIWDEKRDRKKGTPYDFQIFTKEKNDNLAKRVKSIYSEGKQKDPEVFKEDIKLNPYEIERIVGFLQRVNLNQTDLDSKGKAFETFMGSFFRGEFGQYFTPRGVVKFIVNVLNIENKHKVLDTSCGSGGFLLYALDKVRNLASEYHNENTVEHFKFWHDFAEKNLFGIEINEQIARTAKMNMIIHDDGHTNVISHDGLEDIELMESQRKTKKSADGFKRNSFDFIITNPPFGSTIKFKESVYLQNYDLGFKRRGWFDERYNNIDIEELKKRELNEKEKEKYFRDSQSSEILFIEQCYNFLKPTGVLAIVIPDGILTNSSLDYVREWISEHYKILAIVSLPQHTFTANGAGVKSSIMFLQKLSIAETEVIKKEKQKVQDRLFIDDGFEAKVKELEKEREAKIKRGNYKITEIEKEIISKLEAVANGIPKEEFLNSKAGREYRDSLIESEIFQIEFKSFKEKEAKKQIKEFEKIKNDEIKEYRKSDEFKDWVSNLREEYREQIEEIKELVDEKYQEAIKKRLNNYPIFMAIAEEIGIDATGRVIEKNDLPMITEELKEFLQGNIKDSL